MEFFKNGESIKDTGFKTDFVGDSAVEFLDEHHGSRGDQPFCLTVPFFAPHDPFDYQPEEYRAPYKTSDFPCYPEPPGHPQRRFRHRRYEGDREAKTSYSALVTGVDHNVGKVLSKLDELGLRENTVVIFSADQGYNCGHHGFWGKGNGTIPFNMYEESIRVPLIWSHAGRIPGGKRVSAMVSSYDFFPTLLDYLGIETAADPQRLGRSYAPFLRGETPEWTNELYFEFGYVRSIRTETLKYVERGDGWGGELFDLEGVFSVKNPWPGRRRTVEVPDPDAALGAHRDRGQLRACGIESELIDDACGSLQISEGPIEIARQRPQADGSPFLGYGEDVARRIDLQPLDRTLVCAENGPSLIEPIQVEQPDDVALCCS